MYPSNKILLACIVLFTCLQGCSKIAQPPIARSPYPDGQLELFNADRELKCSMPFVHGTFPLNVKNGPCPDSTWDDVVSFRVVGVPSASTFTLYDDEQCSARTDQRFIFAFKVVKNPTTMTDMMPVEAAGATQLGQLVEGTTLRMEKKLRNRPAEDYLGCVQISRSQVPEN